MSCRQDQSWSNVNYRFCVGCVSQASINLSGRSLSYFNTALWVFSQVPFHKELANDSWSVSYCTTHLLNIVHRFIHIWPRRLCSIVWIVLDVLFFITSGSCQVFECWAIQSSRKNHKRLWLCEMVNLFTSTSMFLPVGWSKLLIRIHKTLGKDGAWANRKILL